MKVYVRFFYILPLLLAGCFSSIETRGVQFLVDKEANYNAPIALDFVAVADAGLLHKLAKFSAWQWFDRRKQIQQDNPQLLKVWSWEIVPGSDLERFEIPSYARKSEGVIIFANYATPGLHRVRLGPFEEVLLQLQKREMRIRVIGN